MARSATLKSPGAVADALHSAAIHLLRRVRQEDDRTGVTPGRLSALSVLVFAILIGSYYFGWIPGRLQ